MRLPMHTPSKLGFCRANDGCGGVASSAACAACHCSGVACSCWCSLNRRMDLTASPTAGSVGTGEGKIESKIETMGLSF